MSELVDLEQEAGEEVVPDPVVITEGDALVEAGFDVGSELQVEEDVDRETIDRALAQNQVAESPDEDLSLSNAGISLLFDPDRARKIFEAVVPKGARITNWYDVAEYFRGEDEDEVRAFVDITDRFLLGNFFDSEEE